MTSVLQNNDARQTTASESPTPNPNHSERQRPEAGKSESERSNSNSSINSQQVRTQQQIRLGRSKKSRNSAFWATKNEIQNFWRNLDEQWPTDRRKNVKFFHTYWHYHNAFTVGL